MEEVTYWYVLVVLGIFLSACSQLLLKKSATKEHVNVINSLMNYRVIIAYFVFFCSLFINITAMSNGINLKDIPILESLGYVFVPILSFFILKEQITIRTVLSILLIIMGLIIFYL